MKALLDYLLSFLLLILLAVPILTLIVIAKRYNGGTGIFKQKRLGKNGKLFTIYKLQTFCKKTKMINKVGFFMRKFKLDEIPQLVNILIGEMSFVGPRPETPEYADRLKGEFYKILKLKPGLTSPASLKYINEERILSQQEYPEVYNANVIYPDKMKMNLDYYYTNNFVDDIKIIILTILKIFFNK